MSTGSDQGAEHAAPIIQRFLDGDPLIFDALQKRITRYVARLYYGDEVEREDLVADIIHILLRSLKKNYFTGNTLADLRNYIFGIARFRVMQVIERRERRKLLFEQLGKSEQPVNSPSKAAAIDARQLLDRICAEIDADGARLLRLKFELGWSNSEIAAHLQKSPNAISTALSRCIAKVRELGLVKELLYPNDGTQE